MADKSGINWDKVPSGIDWDAVSSENDSNSAPQEPPKSSKSNVRRNPLYRLGSGVINSILEPTRLAATGLSAISKPGAMAETWGQDLTASMQREQDLDKAAIGDDKLLYGLDLLGSMLSPTSKIPTAKLNELVNAAKLPSLLSNVTKGVGGGLIGAGTTPGDMSEDKFDKAASLGAGIGAGMHALGKTTGLVGSTIAHFLGGGSGIKEAYQANKVGGSAAKAYWDAKNGLIHPSEVTDELMAAKEVMDRARSKAYNVAKEPLVNSPYKITNKDYIGYRKAVMDAMDTATEFGQSVSPDVSKVKAGVRDIIEQYNTNRGLDVIPSTAGGLNYLRGSLNYYKDSLKSGGGLAAQQRVPAVIADELNTIMARRIPGWFELQRDNSVKEKALKDIEKSLALNDVSGTEAAINKTLKGINNEFKGELLDELQKYGPKDIIPKLAGIQTKNWLPTGLGKGSQMAAVAGSLYYHEPMLALLAALQSPKVMGSAAGHLGATNRGLESLLKEFIGSPQMLDQVLLRSPQYMESE